MSAAPPIISLAATLFGLSGITLNAALFTLLSTGSMSQSVPAYRISLQIGAVHGFLMSACWITMLVSHVFYNGLYINVLFGAFPLVCPRWLTHTIFACGVLLNTGWWQLTPAPCILQYLHLSNGLRKNGRPLSTVKGLVTAYALTVFLLTFTAFWTIDFLPTSAFQRKLDAGVRKAYNLSAQDKFLAYGLSVERDPVNHSRSLKEIAFLAILPTYAAAYSAFFIVIQRSRRLLKGLTPMISVKTAKLQKRFIKLQIIQGLVPLISQIPSFAAFFFYLSLHIEGVNSCLIQTLSYYALPSMQGGVCLFFVHFAPRRQRTELWRKEDSNLPRTTTLQNLEGNTSVKVTVATEELKQEEKQLTIPMEFSSRSSEYFL